MQWVETINARMAGTAMSEQYRRFFMSIRSQVDEAYVVDLVRLAIYRNGLVENDWSIHLHWQTEARPHGKSELGIKLADIIRPIALVDHSIWLETTKNMDEQSVNQP